MALWEYPGERAERDAGSLGSTARATPDTIESVNGQLCILAIILVVVHRPQWQCTTRRA